MHNLKTVDKFQFIQEESISDGEVIIISAWHSVLNRAYTLKQIIISQNSKGRYAALLREVNILKSISGEWAIKCHKMLRTAHNVYFAYDRFGDNTLQDYFKATGRLKGSIQKQELALKLIGLVIYLKQAKVVNLNILPRNIQVIKRQLKESVDIVLRINNFQYAILIDEGQDQGILETLQVNQYHPPQILAKPPIIGQHCHIFTIGKIIQKLCLSQNNGTSFKKDLFQKEKIHKLLQIINKMTILDHRKRITSDQISQFYSNFVVKPKSRILRNRLTKCKQVIELTAKDLCIKTQGNKTNFKQNSKNQFSSKWVQKQQREEISQFSQLFAVKQLLLLSTSNYSYLQSYLFYYQKRVLGQSRNSLSFKIAQKDWRKYSKQQQYNKLRSIIQTQMSLSKVKLNLYVQKLHNNCGELFDDLIFKKETQQQSIDDEYLTDRIIFAIKILIQNRCIQIQSKENLKYLLLMSYVKEFLNFQHMFEELINEQVNLLSHQTLMIKIEELSQQQIINKLQCAIKQYK